MPSIQFKGKSFVQNHHLAVPFHELIAQPKKGLSKKPSLDDNLLIQGDNLVALKALLPDYAGKVKCIYIDPPYNTGNESWVYNDNVRAPVIQDWIGKVVGGEDEDLTRHDKWLCMMMPRLRLLRELLSDDGAIFASIDDTEVSHLRMLMDEVFGRGAFVGSIIWRKKASPDARSTIGSVHDYILCYVRNASAPKKAVGKMSLSSKRLANFTNPDDDPRGPWASVDMTGMTGRATKDQYFDVTLPSGKVIGPPKGRSWGLAQQTFEDLRNDNRIWFGKSGNNVPRQKLFLSEVEGQTVPTYWDYTDVGSNEDASDEIIECFGGEKVFDTPKPTELIKQIIGIATRPNKGDIILDSFAGAGTTGCATLELNKEDGGDRRFILVEMEDYADRITAERIRRVSRGVSDSKSELLKNGLGGTFSYFEIGRPMEPESMLGGKKLPSFVDLARYVFYTATGEQFDERRIREERKFVGSSKHFDVYMLYEPDLDYLKSTALTLDQATKLRKRAKDRPLLVFAPTKYIDQLQLDHLKITFQQLPFQIYRVTPDGTS